MRKNNRTFLALVIILFLLIFGCTTNKKTVDKNIVVERQVCFLKHFTHLQENDCDLVITADLSVKGSEELVDSITVFLNKQLYMYFDNIDDVRLPYEKVFSTDIPHLLEHYREAYSPYFDEDSTHVCEFGTHCLELNMVAQTTTYLTYEVVNVFYGEGHEEARSWITFAKSDGHKVKDVITKENMMQFFQEHPELIDSDVWNDILHKKDNNDIIQLDNVGLLNDSLAFQYVWTTGIYGDFKYDLETVTPYLSAEAQKMIK